MLIKCSKNAVYKHKKTKLKIYRIAIDHNIHKELPLNQHIKTKC